MCKSVRVKSRSIHGPLRAFTLVEVVLAIGIAATAILGIFALTQGGLRTYRDSLNASVGVSIGQEVLAQYLLADYDKVAGSTSAKTNDYDARGLLLKTTTGDPVYRSVAEVLPASDLALTTNNLVKLRIEVTSPTQPNWKKTFVSLIARQGDDRP